jgi:hypothetical protein
MQHPAPHCGYQVILKSEKPFVILTTNQHFQKMLIRMSFQSITLSLSGSSKAN